MATDGPYRVGNHSPINVWWDPHRDYATSEQVCMATSPEWGRRIVAALNAREVEPVVDSELRDRIAQYLHTAQCDIISGGPWDCGKSETHWQDWREVADIAMGAVLAERDDKIRVKDVQLEQLQAIVKFQQRRAALAEAALEPMQTAHEQLVEAKRQLRERNRAYGRASATIGQLRAEAAFAREKLKSVREQALEQLLNERGALRAELEHARRALLVGIPSDVREAFTDAPIQRLAVEVSQLARRPVTEATEQAELDTSIGGAADKAWFAAKRAAITPATPTEPRCCFAGALSSPGPCPWHGEQSTTEVVEDQAGGGS